MECHFVHLFRTHGQERKILCFSSIPIRHSFSRFQHSCGGIIWLMVVVVIFLVCRFFIPSRIHPQSFGHKTGRSRCCDRTAARHRMTVREQQSPPQSVAPLRIVCCAELQVWNEVSPSMGFSLWGRGRKIISVRKRYDFNSEKIKPPWETRAGVPRTRHILHEHPM
jgi:hypothetical protein